MDGKDVWTLFKEFDKKYFWNQLNSVRLSWSPNMTLCAGKTAFRWRKRSQSSCSIRLSQPLLSQRPHSDTVNTLLHEMIHSYLHITQGPNYRDSHGPEFRNHMKRINNLHGSKITIYHNFRKEVDKFRIHVYRCDGPCTSRRPFFGILRRAVPRPPGPNDKWWAKHQAECGGIFLKIEGPGAISSTVHTTAGPENKRGSLQPTAQVPVRHNAYENINNETHGVKGKNEERLSSPTKPPSHDMIEGNYEDNVVKRIKDKYSHTKQTILLSKGNEMGSQYIRPEYSYRHHSLPDGSNLVEGHINTRYHLKSRLVNINKYLSKFAEANGTGESLPTEGNTFVGGSVPTRVESSEETCNSGVTYNDDHRCNVVDGRMNYSYQPKSRTKLNIRKYISRYKEAKEALQSQEVKVDDKSTGESSFVSGYKASSHPSVTKTAENESSKQELKESCICPICNIKISPLSLEAHLSECLGDDLDSDIDFSESEKSNVNVKSPNGKSNNNKGLLVQDEYWDQLPEVKTCQNCGSRVLTAEMNIHLQYCIDSDSEESGVENFRKAGDVEDRNINMDSFDAGPGMVSCPSCMEKVKEQAIQEHLDECLKFLAEEF